MTYGNWIDRHARAFGLDRDSDKEMLGEWASVFSSDGYTPDELDAATTAMLSNPPRFRNEHLLAIHRSVKASRRPRQPIAEDYIGECVLCGNTAFVVVPHPAYVVNFEWIPPRYTAAVLCSCGLGRWMEPRLNDEAGEPGKRPKMLTLTEYVLRVGNWKELMQQKEHSDSMNQRVFERAKSIDKILGPIGRGAH